MCEYDSIGIFKRSFIYGNYIDEALAMDLPGPAFLYYVHDHLYSPAALMSIGGSGAVVERYEYDAYGRVKKFVCVRG